MNNPLPHLRVPSAAALGGLMLAAALGSPAAAQQPDLDPRRWGPGELRTFDSLTTGRDRSVPLASGDSGVVAATTGAAAVRAGLEALRRGGTAVDAVLTHALADIVLMGQTVVSHAGIMMLVYYEARTGRVYAMNAGWNTVKGETDPLSIPTATPTGRAVLVPGFMAGAEAAHRRFGRLPWATLFEPAIYFAEEGVPYTRNLAGMIAAKKARLEAVPASKAVFIRPDGRWYEEGDRFRQPALAATLRRVASDGASYMYRGPWAKKLVAAVQAAGGKLTMADLADYRVLWSDPIRTRFREYEVLSLPPPSYGGVNLLEALNLVEAADLRSLGPYQTSAPAFDRLTSIARVGDLLGTSIITMLLGPPRLSLIHRYLGDLDLDFAARVTKPHARALVDKMGTPSWREFDRTFFTEPAVPPSGHSDGVVAVDPQGNVAALLHTSNTTTWGMLGLIIDGVGISDPGRYQQRLMALTRPGSRLPDPTNPSIVLKAGKPVLASSSIGVGLHEQTLQSLVNVLEYGMDPKAAADAPQFLRPEGLIGAAARPRSDSGGPAIGQIVVEGDFSPELIAAVRALGGAVTVLPPKRAQAAIGAWVGAKLDPATGKKWTAVQGVSNGWALGY